MKLDEQTISAHLKEFFGYEPKPYDPLIKHYLTQVETLIKNFCHRSDIPEGAVHPAIDYICGRYLLHKINTGTLVDDDGSPLYSFSAPETSVKVGNVSVNYESGYGSLVEDNGFLSLVNQLASEENFKKEIVHFRKVKWR